MLQFNLHPIFKARGIYKPYAFLVQIGFSPYSATSILNNKGRGFKLDEVERLCHALICEPNDLLLWTPAKGQQYTANYPLAKLRQNDFDRTWHETLGTLPLKELKEVTKAIMDKDKDKTTS